MANFMGKNAGLAEALANKVVDQFRDGKISKAMAHIFLSFGGDRPCDKWSWMNRFLQAMAGHDDSRTFRQWQSVDRCVTKGEKAFHILEPVRVKRKDKTTGDDKFFVVGFRAAARFGYDQTNGTPLPEIEKSKQFLSELPLQNVIDAWGIKLRAYNGANNPAAGWYSTAGKSIAMGVENLATYAHELVHAADDRLGNLTERGQHWRSETVAELGGAILLQAIGLEREADVGGCWEYVTKYAKDNDMTAVDACMRVLKRTCDAVALILDAAKGDKAETCDADAVAA